MVSVIPFPHSSLWKTKLPLQERTRFLFGGMLDDYIFLNKIRVVLNVLFICVPVQFSFLRCGIYYEVQLEILVLFFITLIFSLQVQYYEEINHLEGVHTYFAFLSWLMTFDQKYNEMHEIQYSTFFSRCVKLIKIIMWKLYIFS